MLTIAIISQKGGAGKTTIGLNLAARSEALGRPAIVVDLDPQASATSWSDQRGEDAPVVVSAQAARLGEVLSAAAAHGAEFAVVDTAPHSEASALAAARAATLVLIPCRPAVFDLRAVASSGDISALAGTPAVAVLNAVPPRGPLADEAQDAIRSYGLPVAPARIGHRVAFVHSATAGQAAGEYEPDGLAAREIAALYDWMTERASATEAA